ncbi:MAG TPA: ribose 1,5-bisphosphate isomerase [Methanomicrobiales archaeon]|nr:ribose 1,5-bisphosphate isomerase [Methanomicrobiales archaeon]
MSVPSTAEKIKRMEIRGAGRIARAAVEALRSHAGEIPAKNLGEFKRAMEKAGAQLLATRPTAVSLPNAVHLVMAPLAAAKNLEEARDGVIRAADRFLASSKGAVERIGEIGAHHIADGETVLTHCNSEAALSCILTAARQGKDFEVYATEVRPGNQGLITLRVLSGAGIPAHYIVDSAVRHFMHRIDRVFVGADAVAVNGAVVNKIGTSQVALAAHEARVPFIVAAETYKFAPRTTLGELVEIEERAGDEVLPAAEAARLPGVRVHNPVFDVTPASYVDLIVTEEGAIPPSLAYIIIREFLGWSIEEFHKTFQIAHRDQG